LAQKCQKLGVNYDCGITGREVLISLIGDNPVTRKKLNTDRYRRTVARCFNDGENLGPDGLTGVVVCL